MRLGCIHANTVVFLCCSQKGFKLKRDQGHFYFQSVVVAYVCSVVSIIILYVLLVFSVSILFLVRVLLVKLKSNKFRPLEAQITNLKRLILGSSGKEFHRAEGP